MAWNHRVIREDKEYGALYAIHEVYYEDGKPVGYTEKPLPPIGETLGELEFEIDRFKEAIKKPVLTEDDFDYE